MCNVPDRSEEKAFEEIPVFVLFFTTFPSCPLTYILVVAI